MMKIFYSKDAQFELTDEEFSGFIKQIGTGPNQKVWIPRLKVFLSSMFIWAGEKPEDKTAGRLHDGTRVIKKFGQWVDAVNEKIKLDPSYYPEILSDTVMSESEWKVKNNSNTLQNAINYSEKPLLQ